MINRLHPVPGGVKIFAWAAAILLFLSIPGFGEITVIENPKPTHFEKNTRFVKLEKVDEITIDINDEVFMGDPVDLALAPDGSLFVMDRIVKQIFQFDKNLKYIRSFGRDGGGPGEFGYNRNPDPIRFSYDGYLYVGEHENKKLIRFSPSGKYIKDIKLPYSLNIAGSFVPCVDKNGNYYVLAWDKNRIEVFDKDMKPLYTVLDKKEYERVLYVKLNREDSFHWTMSYMGNTHFDTLPDNRLIVCIGNTNCIYIFDKDKLVRKFDVWPEMALKYYKEITEKRFAKRVKNEIFSVKMSYRFFLDKDDAKYFYLEGSMGGNKKHLHYKVDLEGKLEKILYTEKPVKMLAKRNNRFYGIERRSGTIEIYKEVGND